MAGAVADDHDVHDGDLPVLHPAERFLGAKGVTDIAKIRVDLDPGDAASR